jgi:sugar phosphate isomerase/epimerase
MDQLTRDDLVCSYFTLHGTTEPGRSRFSFEARVAAAAAAGFAGMGLITDAYEADRASGLTDADMRAILDDRGIVLAELDFLFDWSADPDETTRVENARALEATAWAMADAFGARVVNAGELIGAEAMPPLEVVAERYATLCDRAAEHGLLVALEFLPWSGIPDAATAGAIARGAERPNAGVNADVWHHTRGSNDDAALRAIADRVFMVQVDDADPEPVGELIDDTWLNRRYPGEGSFDVEGFVRLLDEAGATAPISVEICSAEHFTLPVDEAARLAYDSTKKVVDAARRAIRG